METSSEADRRAKAGSCIKPQLLRADDTARYLGISRRTFYRRLAVLRARGLQVVHTSGGDLYVRDSLDLLIRRAVRTGKPMW